MLKFLKTLKETNIVTIAVRRDAVGEALNIYLNEVHDIKGLDFTFYIKNYENTPNVAINFKNIEDLDKKGREKMNMFLKMQGNELIELALNYQLSKEDSNSTVNVYPYDGTSIDFFSVELDIKHLSKNNNIWNCLSATINSAYTLIPSSESEAIDYSNINNIDDETLNDKKNYKFEEDTSEADVF